MNAAANEVIGETAAEFLRMAIPLMSRHNVPATPDNYATWYMYVSGENADLNAVIDRQISESSEFTAAINTELYRRYVAEPDLDNVEKIRTDLKTIICEVGTSLNEAGDGAQKFEGSLGGFANDVAAKKDLNDIRRRLTTLIAETRTMQAITNDMQTSFESKSQVIDDLQEQLQHERQRAITDPLTGLHNRLALIDQLNAAMGEMDEGERLSLVMLDIDYFKTVNDNHGHLIGDRVIRFVAQILQKNIKGKDTAARYGGDEFTLLLPGTPSAGAKSLAETIRKAIAGAQLVRADTKEPLGQITLSAGVAGYRGGEDIMEFIDRADQGLYRSKKEGRNRVSLA